MTTKIEWAKNEDGTQGESWNPIKARRKDNGKVGWFCTKTSPGCANCYAEAMNQRFGTGLPYDRESFEQIELCLDYSMKDKPLLWKKPRRVFVESMGDFF